MSEQSFIDQVLYLQTQDEETIFPQMQFLRAFQQIDVVTLAQSDL